MARDGRAAAPEPPPRHAPPDPPPAAADPASPAGSPRAPQAPLSAEQRQRQLQLLREQVAALAAQAQQSDDEADPGSRERCIPSAPPPATHSLRAPSSSDVAHTPGPPGTLRRRVRSPCTSDAHGRH
mmetsp:Transcript_29717/g.44883  ORF Transcript_29717/g.44883 Transcript_29717/m.44883 type:complete len:127 (+) Transcript_29717:71-451(+)